MSETGLPDVVTPKRRFPWGAFLAWAGLCLVLGVVGVGLLRAQQGPVAIGRSAPAFTLTTFEGEQISLQSLRGKIVVLNFWASWCKPCEQEAADLESAWRAYQPGGEVVFLGVAWSDIETDSKGYIDRFGITYPNGFDMGTRIAQAYRITGVPETYIIDQEGVLAAAKIGPFESLAEIMSIIDALRK